MGLLDQTRYPFDDLDGWNLLDVLADLYNPRPAELLCRQAGLRTAIIDFRGSAREVWRNILDSAAKSGKLRALAQVIIDDPESVAVRPLLRRLLEEAPQARPAKPAATADVIPAPARLDRQGTMKAPEIAARPSEVAGHVFISYIREDSLRVDLLQQALEAAGVRVWRDTQDLWPGEDWRLKIRRAITDNALVFLACFSSRSLARSKSYQNEELLLAIEQLRLRPPEDPWLIPVRFDDCEIPERDIGGGRTLTSIQRADLFHDHFDEGVARVLTTVLRILGRLGVVRDQLDHLPTTEMPRRRPAYETSSATGSNGPASRYLTAVLADQPIAYWQFNDEAGSPEYTDSSGNGNTLPAGLTVLARLDHPGDAGAIKTAAGGTYTSTPLSPLIGDAPRTVEAWFNTTSGGCILAAGSAIRAEAFSLCLMDGPYNSPTPGTPGFYLQTYDADVFVPIANMTDAHWHYLALTLTGNTVHIIIDGAQPRGYIWNGAGYGGLTDQPFTLPHTPHTGFSPLGVGTASPSGISRFVGTITEVAVYPRALPVSNLIKHYQLFTGSTSTPKS